MLCCTLTSCLRLCGLFSSGSPTLIKIPGPALCYSSVQTLLSRMRMRQPHARNFLGKGLAPRLSKKRRAHNFATAGQSKAVCKDGIHCTALPQVHSALRWLVHYLLLYVNIMYVISHAYSTGRGVSGVSGVSRNLPARQGLARTLRTRIRSARLTLLWQRPLWKPPLKNPVYGPECIIKGTYFCILQDTSGRCDHQTLPKS